MIFVINQLIKSILNSCIIQIIKKYKGHERASSDVLAEPDEGGDAVGGVTLSSGGKNEYVMTYAVLR